MTDSLSSLYLALSFYLMMTGIYLYRRAQRSRNTSLFLFVIAGFYVLLCIAYIVSDYFTGKGINEAVLYHLQYGLQGAGFSEYTLLIISATALLFVLLGLLYLVLVTKRDAVSKKTQPVLLVYGLVAASLLTNPASSDAYLLMTRALNDSDRNAPPFERYYRASGIEALTKAPKNLVMIYVEGLERTYFNENRFPGLIKGLRQLESMSTSFTNIHQLDGTGWTIAGMVASQCGISLVTPSSDIDLANTDQYLPSATCMGDLLQQQGYKLVYYGGSGLEFAGKGKFYRSHGFDEVRGRHDLLPQIKNPDYRTGWGLYDDSLFDLSYQRFLQLSGNEQPFALLNLTLDTHHPSGHPSKSCEHINYGDGENSILNAVACSDYLVSKYVEKILQSPQAENTVVVIVSDHLSIRTTADELLNQSSRKNLFMIIDPTNKNKLAIDRTGSTLDVASTVLPFIGFRGEIGLGRDLRDSAAGLDDEINRIHNHLADWRKSLMAFWELPTFMHVMEVDAKQSLLKIDNKSYRLPLLVEVGLIKDRKGEAGLDSLADAINIHRQFDGAEGSLYNQLVDRDNNLPFLLFDDCSNMQNNELDTRGLCLMSGQDVNTANISRIDEYARFSYNRVRELTGQAVAFRPFRIAHAGGAFNGQDYTNSHQALDENINKGFSYFEIDFSYTRDGHLVCLHDWNRSFTRLFGYELDELPTLAEYNDMRAKAAVKTCTLDSLADWMRANPFATIVTDVKGDNLQALEVISRTLPDASFRVIPQIYDPDNFETIRRAGYEQIIWTLYRYRDDEDAVLEKVKQFSGAFALTMPEKRAATRLPSLLKQLGIPSYVHTVNQWPQAEMFIEKFEVTEIYTDYLHPRNKGNAPLLGK